MRCKNGTRSSSKLAGMDDHSIQNCVLGRILVLFMCQKYGDRVPFWTKITILSNALFMFFAIFAWKKHEEGVTFLRCVPSLPHVYNVSKPPLINDICTPNIAPSRAFSRIHAVFLHLFSHQNNLIGCCQFFPLPQDSLKIPLNISPLPLRRDDSETPLFTPKNIIPRESVFFMIHFRTHV